LQLTARSVRPTGMTDALETLLARMESELGPRWHHDVPEHSLFHYTTSAALQRIVESKTIWATHFKYLNDREEFRIGERIVQDEAERLRSQWSGEDPGSDVLDNFVRLHEKASLTKISTPFVASFSENGDSLSQWRAYGDNGAGYALGLAKFDLPDDAPRDADAALTLVKCQYDADAFRESVRATLKRVVGATEQFISTGATCERDMREIFRRGVMFLLLHAVTDIPRLKHAAFREEAEWRLVVVPGQKESPITKFRPSNRGLVPYVDIPLAPAERPLELGTTYVGPTQDPGSAEETLRAWLAQAGYPKAVVKVSTIPYRG